MSIKLVCGFDDYWECNSFEIIFALQIDLAVILMLFWSRCAEAMQVLKKTLFFFNNACFFLKQCRSVCILKYSSAASNQ